MPWELAAVWVAPVGPASRIEESLAFGIASDSGGVTVEVWMRTQLSFPHSGRARGVREALYNHLVRVLRACPSHLSAHERELRKTVCICWARISGSQGIASRLMQLSSSLSPSEVTTLLPVRQPGFLEEVVAVLGFEGWEGFPRGEEENCCHIREWQGQWVRVRCGPF